MPACSCCGCAGCAGCAGACGACACGAFTMPVRLGGYGIGVNSQTGLPDNIKREINGFNARKVTYKGWLISMHAYYPNSRIGYEGEKQGEKKKLEKSTLIGLERRIDEFESETGLRKKLDELI